MLLPNWITPSGIIATVGLDLKHPDPIFYFEYTNTDYIILYAGFLPEGLTLTTDGYIVGTVSSNNSKIDYPFIIRLVKGNSYSDRGFSIKLIGKPEFITEEGLLTEINNKSTPPYGRILFQYANNIVLTGDVPTGITITKDGFLTGNVSNEIVSKQSYNILIPTWITNSGNIGTIFSNNYQNISIKLDYKNVNKISLVSGILPPGLILNDNGIISGNITTFNVNNIYNFTVKIENSNGDINRNFNIILKDPELFWITNEGTLGDFSPGTTIEPINIKFENAISSYLVNGIIPNGLTYSNGIISGNIQANTTKKVYSFIIRIEDGQNISDRSFNIIIKTPVLEWITPEGNIGNMTPGQKINPIIFEYKNATSISLIGTLPDGLSFQNNQIQGNISLTSEIKTYNFSLIISDGIITKNRNFNINVFSNVGNGLYNFTATISNNYGSVSKNYSILINNSAPIWITKSGNIAIINDSNHNDPLLKLNFQNSNQVLLYSGKLPKGLTLSSDGTIYGRISPFKIGNQYDFTIRLKNYNGYSDRTFNIILKPKELKWITSEGALGQYKPGQTITPINIQYENGIISQISSGRLPEGLILQNNQIFGIINPYIDLKNYTFEIRITDINNNYKDRIFNINISNNPPKWITNSGSLGTISSDLSYNVNQPFAILEYSPINDTKIFKLNGELPENFYLTNTGIIVGTMPLSINIPRKQYKFTARLVNGIGIADRDFSITIESPNGGWINNNIIQEYFLNENIYNNYSLGSIVNYQFTANDPSGISPKYQIINGSLPSGLILKEDGLLTGIIIDNIINVKNFSFTIKAKGSIEQFKDFIMPISNIGNTPPYWLTMSGWLGNLTKNQFFEFNLKGEDKENNVTFKVSNNSNIPPGFNMIPGNYIQNGIISGILTSDETMDYHFDIIISDGELSIKRSFYLRANIIGKNNNIIWGNKW